MVSLIYNPPVTFNGTIHGGFLPSCFIRVQGRIHPAGQNFYVNIEDPSAMDDIGIHVNPRLQHGYIVRNSKLNGKWGHEEKGGPSLKLRRGEPFEILLRAEYGFIRIAVNGEDYATFNHRFTALDRLTNLKISGDITLSLVQIVVDPQARTNGLLFPSPTWAYPLPFVGTQAQGSLGAATPHAVEIGFTTHGKPPSPPPPYGSGGGGNHAYNSLGNIWSLPGKQ